MKEAEMRDKELVKLCVELLVQFKRAERVVLEQTSRNLPNDMHALEAHLTATRAYLAQLSGMTTLDIATLEGQTERELDRQRAT